MCPPRALHETTGERAKSFSSSAVQILAAVMQRMRSINAAASATVYLLHLYILATITFTYPTSNISIKMASFTVAKAPVAAPKAFKGLSKATKPAAKVANVSKASEMMVWTPTNNKCAPHFSARQHGATSSACRIHPWDMIISIPSESLCLALPAEAGPCLRFGRHPDSWQSRRFSSTRFLVMITRFVTV